MCVTAAESGRARERVYVSSGAPRCYAVRIYLWGVGAFPVGPIYRCHPYDPMVRAIA